MRVDSRTLGTDGPGFIGRHLTALKVLLALGVLAPIYYVAVNESVAASFYPGHDSSLGPSASSPLLTLQQGQSSSHCFSSSP